MEIIPPDFSSQMPKHELGPSKLTILAGTILYSIGMGVLVKYILHTTEKPQQLTKRRLAKIKSH